jgi:hypothetical protein
MMLKTIRIYAEFYDGELNSAYILIVFNVMGNFIEN